MEGKIRIMRFRSSTEANQRPFDFRPMPIGNNRVSIYG